MYDGGGGGSAQQPGGRRVQKADDTVFLRKPGDLKKRGYKKRGYKKRGRIVTSPRIAAKRPEYTPMRDYSPSHQSSPGAPATMVVNELDVIDIFSQSASQSLTNVCFLDIFHVGYFVP